MDAISEVYEEDWTGADYLIAQSSAIEVLWQDFSHKLGDQVLIPLNTYAAQFPEMKVSVHSCLIYYHDLTMFCIYTEKDR
jgi:amphiphysin